MPSGGTSSTEQITCITSFPGKNTASVRAARNGNLLKNTRAERLSRRGAESKGSRNSRCIPKVHYMMGRDDAHDHCTVVGSGLGNRGLSAKAGAEALSDAGRGESARRRG